MVGVQPQAAIEARQRFNVQSRLGAVVTAAAHLASGASTLGVTGGCGLLILIFDNVDRYRRA